jgi:hypothetical protein
LRGGGGPGNEVFPRELAKLYDRGFAVGLVQHHFVLY